MAKLSPGIKIGTFYTRIGLPNSWSQQVIWSWPFEKSPGGVVCCLTSQGSFENLIQRGDDPSTYPIAEYNLIVYQRQHLVAMRWDVKNNPIKEFDSPFRHPLNKLSLHSLNFSSKAKMYSLQTAMLVGRWSEPKDRDKMLQGLNMTGHGFQAGEHVRCFVIYPSRYDVARHCVFGHVRRV